MSCKAAGRQPSRVEVCSRTAAGRASTRRRRMTCRGARESVAASRPAEPGASQCSKRTRFDSSLAACSSGVVLLLRRMELGLEVGGGCATPSPSTPQTETDVMASPHPNQAWRGRLARGRPRATKAVMRHASSFCRRPYPGRLREAHRVRRLERASSAGTENQRGQPHEARRVRGDRACMAVLPRGGSLNRPLGDSTERPMPNARPTPKPPE